MRMKPSYIGGADLTLRLISSLTAAVFISTLGMGVFAFAIPLRLLDTRESGLFLGAAFSGYFLAKLVMAPIAGRLSDRIGPFPLLLGAAMIGFLAPMAAWRSLGRDILFTIQLCLGVSAGILKPVATAAIAAQVPAHRRGQVFGLCNAFYNAAFFFGPILGGLLYFHGNLTPVLIFLTGCMGVSLVLIFYARRHRFSTRPGHPRSDTSLRPWPHHGALLLAICGRTAGTAALITFYPVLLSEQLRGPTWLTGFLFATPSLAACLILPLGGWLADRTGRVPLIVSGMALSAVCLGMTGKMDTAYGFLITGIFSGLGSAVSFPAAMAHASASGARQGAIMGRFHGAANAGFVIGPVLCGLLVKYAGEIPLSMGVMGLTGLASTLPLAVGRQGTSRAWRFAALPALTAGLVVMVLLSVQTRSQQPQTHPAADLPESTLNFAGIAMGNVVRLTLSGADAETADDASRAAFDTIARLESEFGHRSSSGSVGRINLAAGTEPVWVESDAFDLISRALTFCKTANGAFDITIGAITVLPFYYQEKAETEKAGLVDYRKVRMDRDAQTVFLPEKGMALDLGGLAKGTVLDGAAETLRRKGIPSALVEAGGDIYCYGDRVWTVGIQDPRGDGVLGVIRVTNAGVCGSGDYYQYTMIEENGVPRRKHHILDPDLLDSAEKSIAVTVVGPTAEIADALATTLFILGPRDGLSLLETYPDCSALWMLPDKRLVASSGFPAFSKELK
ncbi:MAG: thiamine biosynthesis protein ApbE [Deltaproteobacteria bacterium]|nr:MAG: thiamine biosynthesis protein ApbE [Deltaproteobacteria bacterium]